MTTPQTFAAQARVKTTKGSVRSLRSSGMIPGVIYGGEGEPELISVDPKPLMKEYLSSGFFSKLFNIEISGKKQEVLAKELQLHPVTDVPMHVDFQRVVKGSKIHVAVPVKFVNEDKCPGIKLGGILNIVVHDLEIVCPVHAIPQNITVSLEGFDIGRSIHLEDIKLPEGAIAAHPDRDKTLATIVPPASDEQSA